MSECSAVCVFDKRSVLCVHGCAVVVRKNTAQIILAASQLVSQQICRQVALVRKQTNVVGGETDGTVPKSQETWEEEEEKEKKNKKRREEKKKKKKKEKQKDKEKKLKKTRKQDKNCRQRPGIGHGRGKRKRQTSQHQAIFRSLSLPCGTRMQKRRTRKESTPSKVLANDITRANTRDAGATKDCARLGTK
jgi:hypothetical protein